MNQSSQKKICPKCKIGELKPQALVKYGSRNIAGQIVQAPIGRRFVLKCQNSDCDYEIELAGEV
jgi:hypothetical protein